MSAPIALIGSLPRAWSAPYGEVGEFHDPVMWYMRTIGKYVAPPEGKAPIRTYESYADFRNVLETVTWENLLRTDSVVCGSPDHVAERLHEFQQIYGFSEVLCWTRLGGLDNRKVLRCMELMEQKVIPHLRECQPPPPPEA